MITIKQTKTILSSLLFLMGLAIFASNPTQSHAMHEMHSSMQMGVNNKDESEKMDRRFLEMMIPHHKMAVEMANIELEKGSNPEVKMIAAKIKASQSVEIEKMKMWHMQWFGAEPKEMMMEMRMVEELRNASNVDKAFLEMMIPHHLQATDMARKEAMRTSNAKLRDFSFKIIKDQTMEVNEMFTLYQAWTE